MAKQLKLKIKNIQLAQAAGIEKPEEKKKEKKPVSKPTEKAPLVEEHEPPRRKAKAKSSFVQEVIPKEEELKEEEVPSIEETFEPLKEEEPKESVLPKGEIKTEIKTEPQETKFQPKYEQKSESKIESKIESEAKKEPKLGPTGRHVKDLFPQAKVEEKKEEKVSDSQKAAEVSTPLEEEKGKQKVREFKDMKPLRREMRPFDARDRKGLTEGEEERWRKKRPIKTIKKVEEEVIRPTKLKIRIPISIKDLASEMKLKSSELIQKLFLQGMVFTVNDVLTDETVILLLGSEFGCEITIDTAEEDRIQITKKTIQEEISLTSSEQLKIRPPVVAFMGHVDHGKTSLIDTIRKSNRVKYEAGAITQHIGAFQCSTKEGDITILDTPGHEAFSSMRARGAEVTDIVVLVVAGDEGIREQTLEAIQHAKAAKVTILVAINKADKPNFNAENVYRQLADIELLPEAWGGQTITVNTSAVTGEGVKKLLEMLALQAEILELKANPSTRARGTVLESELHKGMGPIATILVQNGTLHIGDAIVLQNLWGRVKTMRNEFGEDLTEAFPATPVAITGLSGVPQAGDSFIAVKDEKEARDIAEVREFGSKAKAMVHKKPPTLESLLQEDTAKGKKILKLILRADVQGSVEALKASLLKIHSEKVDIDVIFTGVGEITESDVQLAAASQAVIFGFHTQIESRASALIKEMGVSVRLHDIIYHAIDDVKTVMLGMLEKIPQENDTGKAEVRAVFKASQLGMIAGCQVIDGVIHRSNNIRVVRGDEVIWKGAIASLKRIKEDVKEVKKGLECGILLQNFNQVQVGDILQSYEIIYLTQEL